MPKEISSKVDYIAEGLALLHHLGTEKNFSLLKESLSQKYNITFAAGQQKFELLSRIEQSARNILQEEMEEISYYFSICDSDESEDSDLSCAATLALLWKNRSGHFENTEEIRSFLHELSEKEYCEKFGEELQYYNEMLMDESKITKMDEPLAIISYLMKMEITDNEKWKLQKIFFDRWEHQEKILDLLDKAVALLKTFRPELEKLTAQFCRYWSAMLKGRSFSSYLQEAAIVESGENPFGFYLAPAIINCNSITINIKLEDNGIKYTTPDNYIIGILFDDDFPIRSRRTQDEKCYADYAAQVLKLLSDKSKFEILSYIRNKASYGSELAKHLNLTTPTVSHHMNALLSAELVTIKREENRVYYLSNQKKIAEVLRYCSKILTGEEETLS